MTVVLGATGKVGSGVANRLLAAGRRLRAVGRRAEGLLPLAARGAEIHVGEWRRDTFST